MVLFPVDILQRNLGVQTVANEITKKEPFWKKRYMTIKLIIH